MKRKLDENKSIFVQIKEQIEDSVINDAIKAGERVPSTNELASFYQINPATAAKGINALVQEQILIKKRGVGMFVTEEAKGILIEKRKEHFFNDFVVPLQDEAKKLHMTIAEVVDMLKKEESDHAN